MKFQIENNAGASETKPKVFTVNIETGKICEEKIQENSINNKNDLNINEKNSTEHVQSSVRLLRIIKSESGACGFNLTRTKWDPYPWVSNVDENTPAEICGLKAGDCVLEVNGEDVLGLRITDIAKLVKAKSRHVTLLLWSAGFDSSKCEPESLCDGPMPRSLQRLSIIVQSILSIIECPVCLDTIPPPAMQCQNGHLLCVNCRIRAEKCPVCRDRYTPRRALIAEQIYAAITSAFNLCNSEDKLRQKLFGTNVQHHPQHQYKQQYEQQRNTVRATSTAPTVTTATSGGTMSFNNDSKSLCRSGGEVCKSKVRSTSERIGVSLPTNKFLTKLLLGKTCSMDSLSRTTATTTTTAMTQTEFGPTSSAALSFSSATTEPTATTISDDSPLTTTTTTTTTTTNARRRTTVAPSTLVPCCCIQSSPLTVRSIPASNMGVNDITTNRPAQQTQSGLNQLHNMATSPASNAQSCTTLCTDRLDDSTPITTTTEIKSGITQVNGMSKHFSLSNNDLRQRRLQLAISEFDGALMRTKVKRTRSFGMVSEIFLPSSAPAPAPAPLYESPTRKPTIKESSSSSRSSRPSSNSYETPLTKAYVVDDISQASTKEILLSALCYS